MWHSKFIFVVTDVGFGTTATGTGMFGPQQQQSTGTSLFGNTAFGAAKPMFGAAATTASTPFGGLSTAGAGTTLFGQASQNKVSSCIVCCNINDNNNGGSVYCDVIMAEPLREFTRFVW